MMCFASQWSPLNQAMEGGMETVKATRNHEQIMLKYQVGMRFARMRKTTSSCSANFSDMKKKDSRHATVIYSREVQLHHLCEQSEEDDDENSCDGHMTLGKSPNGLCKMSTVCMIHQPLMNRPRLQGVCSCCLTVKGSHKKMGEVSL